MKRTKKKKIYLPCGQILAYLLLIVVSVSFFVEAAQGAALDNAQIVDLYGQATELFQRANELAATAPDQARDLYEKSAMRFERIAREGGIKNGRLYYNIGNAYFRMKDIGRAILNYLRADQYIPGDPNLKQNLEYARKKRLDEIEEKQKTQVLKTLFFWHYDLSTKNRVITFAVSFMLLWIFAAIRLFSNKSFVGWSITVLAVLSVLMAGSLVVEETSLHKTRPGVIISSEVIARKGNSETYEPSFKEPLHSGTEFSLIEDRGSWYQVELVDSRPCWLPSKDVELVR